MKASLFDYLDQDTAGHGDRSRPLKKSIRKFKIHDNLSKSKEKYPQN